MHVLIHTFTFVATPPSSSKENTRATENAQTVYTVLHLQAQPIYNAVRVKVSACHVASHDSTMDLWRLQVAQVPRW